MAKRRFILSRILQIDAHEQGLKEREEIYIFKKQLVLSKWKFRLCYGNQELIIKIREAKKHEKIKFKDTDLRNVN